MLYGNTTNTSKTTWQFDKIYESRYAMEYWLFHSNTTAGHDQDGAYIAPGRFVLVSYAYDKDLNYGLWGEDGGVATNPYPVSTDDDYLCAYNSLEDQTEVGKVSANGLLYMDASCQIPYLYTNYSQVIDPVEDDIALYYLKRNNFFFKAPYFVAGETYYKPTISTLSETAVTKGQIVRRRYNTVTPQGETNPTPNAYTEEFYICTGAINIEGTGTNVMVGAAFQPLTQERLIDPNSAIQKYVRNFNIDSQYYRDIDDTWGTLHRGYDCTVWQKVVGEGEERYVLVAHLNALSQGVEIIPEPPTDEPIAPFMGADSTDMLYRLHLQTPWGYRIKPYEEYTGNNIETDQPSDLAVDGKRLAFFYNKAGFNKEYHTNINNLQDSFTLSNTGRSEDFITKYSKATLSGQYDIKELSVMLPSIGNMVSDGYDLLYGNGLEDSNTDHERHLDVEWYTPDDGNKVNLGDPQKFSGGKTKSLNTLAGSLNVFHDRLGQIIHELPLKPDANTIAAEWSQDEIYHIPGINPSAEYFRKGLTYTPHPVSYVFYKCTEDEVNSDTWIPRTYYFLNEGSLYEADDETTVQGILHTETADIEKEFRGDQENTFIAGRDYYRRQVDITNSYYEPISLTKYIPDAYYYKQGTSYIKDLGTTPADPTKNYLALTLDGPFTFIAPYSPLTYYVKDGDDYVFSSTSYQDVTKHYYRVEGQRVASENDTGKTYIYQPGVYYYHTDASGTTAKLANEETFDELKDYYYFEFEKTPTISAILDEDGNVTTVMAYKVERKIPVFFNSRNNGLDCYFVDENDAFRRVTTEWLKKQSADFFLEPQAFVTITVDDVTDKLFQAGEYYIKDTSSGEKLVLASVDIFKAEYQYYKIKFAVALDPFYMKDTYYFKSNQETNESDEDYAERLPLLDNSTEMRDTSTGQYYRKTGLRVTNDVTGECPIGYEWNPNASIVPWPFTLEAYSTQYDAIPIPGLNNGLGTINGRILELSKKMETDDYLIDNTNRKQFIRDTNTLQGALNMVNDKFYTLGNLVPQKLLFTNDYGRVTSSSVTNVELLRLRDYYTPTFAKILNDLKTTVTANTSTGPITGFSLNVTYDENGRIVNDNSASISITRTNAGKLLLTDYTESTTANQDIAATDSINTAFGKLQKTIHDMDSSVAGDGNQVLTGLTQTDGKITNFEQSNIGTLKLAGLITSTSSADIAATDTLNGALGKLQKQLSILNGTATQEGSVKYQIAQVIANAPEQFDTLKELADWITQDETGASALLTTHSSRIAALESKTVLGTQNGNEYTTVKEYVEAVEAGLKGSASDSGTTETIYGAKAYAKQYADGLASNYDEAGAANDVQSALMGTSEDTKNDITLYGLLAYITELEERLATLEQESEPDPTPDPEGE